MFETEEEDEAENQRPLLYIVTLPCKNIKLSHTDSYYREELDIDPADILYKIRSVVFPYKVDREVLVRSPDFWGPLIVVMLYAIFVIQFSVRDLFLFYFIVIFSPAVPLASHSFA